MSKKDKRPSFSFSNENFMLMLGRQIFLKFFCLIDGGKQYKYIINILSIEDRLQTMRAVFKPYIFKTKHKNIS